MKKLKVALAGQPNCGKSTIFNLVSGIEQHIANYPGVTVDKKTGYFKYDNHKIEMVDLPGTYSFSSFSLEERVAKEFILNEKPDVIVNVIDASNIKRHLYLTFQLLEIGIPVVVVLNMMDVAKRRSIDVDSNAIQTLLNTPVIEASGAKGVGAQQIMQAIVETASLNEQYEEFQLDYEELESPIHTIQTQLNSESHTLSSRWLAIKALEEDESILSYLQTNNPNIQKSVQLQQKLFHEHHDKDVNAFLAAYRYESADVIYHKAIKERNKGAETLTDKADRLILNRFLALPILILLMFLVYQISIVGGYKLTDYTWPILASFKNLVIDILPQANMIDVPMLTDFGVWMVNSANALLNYIPIFFILFALIAIMEDVGYMPRMAFILDRVFRRFGLHGQSTLPLVLGGAMVGGCAVPGVMATKGIADERARMATILAVPYMNCLAKVPFYTLLLGAFLKPDMAWMMFFISTVTLFIAMIVAKLLTSTVLKSRETAPFLMELPPYHLPTIKGVIFKAFQRVWLYIKKVVSIVLAVAVVLFALLQFPGLDKTSALTYYKQANHAISKFQKEITKTVYISQLNETTKVSELLNYYDSYKAQRMIVSSQEDATQVDQKFQILQPDFFKFVKPKGDKEARVVNKALRKLSSARKTILREMKNEKVENSLLGMAGRAIEPVTQFAGFDWKINVAFLSSFAARESAVATLGSIYENNQADNMRAEKAMALNSGYTPLHAVAIIIFMILTPPCIATMIVVKMQTNSYKWMLFAIFFPVTLGIMMASVIFSLGSLYSWTGLEAMSYFYLSVVLTALVIAFLPRNALPWRGGFCSKAQGQFNLYKHHLKKEIL